MKALESKNLLPLFEFPTKVILLDDNADYVESLKMLFSPKGIQFETFTNPLKALEYLRSKDYCKFVNQYLGLSPNMEIFGKTLDVSLSDLHQVMYDPKRFNEASTLVVDYAMPSLDGQSFCNEVKDLPIKKLLLTGEASYEKAVEMFNDKVIHKFVKKHESHHALLENIQKLQREYFQSITQNLLFGLEGTSENSPFSDDKFISFFNDLCETHNFIEYYAVDESGSYLLANKSGELKLLIVKSEEDMQVLYEIAEGDRKTPDATLNALANRDKLTFLQSEDDLILPASDWKLHDAKKLEGESTYYYALVDADTNFTLNGEKPFWYENHLAAA